MSLEVSMLQFFYAFIQRQSGKTLEQAAAAVRSMDGADDSRRAFLDGKLHAARFFFRYELPHVERRARWLQRMDDTALTMPDAGF